MGLKGEGDIKMERDWKMNEMCVNHTSEEIIWVVSNIATVQILKNNNNN